MALEHERRELYELALKILVFANEIVGALPRRRRRTRRRVAEQFARAAMSIVLHLAERADRHSKPGEPPYDLTAKLCALLDVCRRLELLDDRRYEVGKEWVERFVAMLVSRRARHRGT